MSDDKRDLSKVEDVVANYANKCGSSSEEEAMHDLLTDMMHLATRQGFHLSWARAWDHYAAESGRCKYCGMTKQDLAEDADEPDNPSSVQERLESCEGYFQKHGDIGSHDFEWDDIEEDRRTSA